MEWKTCLSHLVEHQSSCKEGGALYICISQTFIQLTAEEIGTKVYQKQH